MKKLLFLALPIFLISNEAMAVVVGGRASAHSSAHSSAHIAVMSSAANRNHQDQIARNSNPMFSDGFVICPFVDDSDEPGYGEMCLKETINNIRKKRTFKEYVIDKKGDVEYLGYQLMDYRVAIFFKRK